MLKHSSSCVDTSKMSVWSFGCHCTFVAVYNEQFQNTCLCATSHQGSGLEPSEYSYYKPISKLSFIGKLLEKMACLQLLEALCQNSFENVQSGFRQHHSTEPELIRAANDTLRTADTGECFVLLLDSSAAFHTIDPQFFLDRLQH